jgi:hypothetical protein
MDNQLPSPNTPVPAEGQPVGSKESLTGQVVPAPENTPAPINSPSGVVQPTLTASDVAAAIAATPTVGAQANPVASTPSPSLAGDVDVIEPEWVDKAEAAVREHHGDPYGEEEAIEKLQEDYLQKRYGINVAEPDADNPKPKGT